MVATTKARPLFDLAIVGQATIDSFKKLTPRRQGRTLASHEQLACDPWLHDLIGEEVAQVNAKLAQYETIKRFALLDHDFTFDGGQLTYTLKLKRRVIAERYADIIEGLYADVERPV